MPFKTKPNQEFLRFLSMQNGDKNNLPNVDLLLDLEKEYPETFMKVMANFEEAKSYRTILNEDGIPKKLTWEEAIKRYSSDVKYVGATDENRDIEKLFIARGMPQESFELATRLRKEMKEKNIPEHILGKELKEETILESIEKIKNRTQEELLDGKEMIEKLYEKQFTYEWLSKNDPRNSIIGVYCDCCASILSNCYGKKIAISSVVAEDVQNLVIKNYKGDIISKGTMYVNKKLGYAVINEFELSREYRKDEIPMSGGVYRSPKGSKEEDTREMIFKAFLRGLKAFREEYDKQNPNKPIEMISIGSRYNRLRRQIQRYKRATENLEVPFKYDFEDAVRSRQYILYDRAQREREEKREKEGEGLER